MKDYQSAEIDRFVTKYNFDFRTGKPLDGGTYAWSSVNDENCRAECDDVTESKAVVDDNDVTDDVTVQRLAFAVVVPVATDDRSSQTLTNLLLHTPSTSSVISSSDVTSFVMTSADVTPCDVTLSPRTSDSKRAVKRRILTGKCVELGKHILFVFKYIESRLSKVRL